MTIEFKKQVEVTETFELNLPACYGKVNLNLPYDEYMKVISEKDYLHIILYRDGDFHCTRYCNGTNAIHEFVNKGEAISEAEFLKAVQECYTRFFLAAETSKDETEEVTAFEDILT